MSIFKSIFTPEHIDAICRYDLEDYIFSEKSIVDLQIEHPANSRQLSQIIHSCQKEFADYIAKHDVRMQ